LHHFIYEFSIIIGVGIGAQWVAWKLKWPPIVLWMVGGLLIGQYFHLVSPKESLGPLFHPLVELASAIILFEGGLTLKYKEFAKVGDGIRRLITSGLLIHFTLLTLAGHYIAGWSWEFSFLVSSILIVTGPTVIAPMIRQIRLKTRPSTFLKWEGIVNDPIGALLAVLTYEYISFSGSAPGTEVVLSSLQAVFVAAAVSFGVTYILKTVFIHGLIPDFLKVPSVFAFVLMVFAFTTALQGGSGLLAVTLFGLFLGNQDLPVTEDVKKFKESISTFLIATLFVALSASLEIEQLKSINQREILFIAFVLFVLRQIAIWLSTIGSGMSWKEKLTISWFAPRGIVAASVAGVLGHKLLAIDFAEGSKLVPVVFAVIFLSVFIFGFTIKKLVDFLKLTGVSKNGVILICDSDWSIDLAKLLGDAGCKVLVISQSKLLCKKARKQGINSLAGEVIDCMMNDEIDFSKYSALLALTENSSYNALVCQKLAAVFDSNNVYQLPLQTDEENSPQELPQFLRGRFLNLKLNYEKIYNKYSTGKTFVAATPTDTNENDNVLDVIFYMDGDGTVQFPEEGKLPEEYGKVVVL
jgi:NhaP-type Na+/H+ or K+/H+ antiporter